MELHDLTALEQGAAIRRGETSTAELIAHYRARIEALDDTLGAFVTLVDRPDIGASGGALGRPGPTGVPGPLAGVPTAIKDLANTAGVRTTYGAEAFAEHVPTFSDAVVRRIEAAGMPWLGKTATPEFGSPCYTEPAGRPPAVTPYDTGRMAGGSSGGSAAAVAGGLVPLAHASDGGGSIRIPASCCGLVGLKPSRGRVSGAPMYGEVTGLSTQGPLARTVRDAAAFLDVMAGPEVGDPSWAPPEAGSFLEACERPPRRLRVARFAEPVIAEAEVAPECLEAWERTSALLEELGHEVVDIAPPMSGETALPAFVTVWSVLTSLSTVGLPEGAPLRPLTRWLGERGAAYSAPEFGLALGEIRRIAARALADTTSYDAVLTPTLAQLPLPVGALRDDEDPEADFLAQTRFTPWTSMWNVTGSPAVSLPLHHDEATGLPVGVMLAGRPAGEASLLALAAQLEHASPWHHRHPPCW